MKLLNPLFDTVFKYLMEDLGVAKALIEAIIKKEIVELYPAPQESTGTNLKMKYAQMEILRQDYVAIIKTSDQNQAIPYEKIVIEVQKSPFIPEIGRFRNYLADKYMKKSSIPGENASKEEYLPIKTIYLVEDVFNDKLPAVLGRRGRYYDELENTEYTGAHDKTVELFAHDTWFIQVEKLPADFKDELMYILSVFAPFYRKSRTDRFIEIPDNDLLVKKHRILEKIIRRLEAATQDNRVNKAVDMEIDYEDFILRNIKDKEIAEKLVEEAKEQIEVAKKQIEEAQLALEIVKRHVKGKTVTELAKQYSKSEAEIRKILDE